MGPLNLGSLFLHRCVQLLFVILEINNPCGSESFRMAAVLHILGKRLLLFWINSQLSWRRCIRSVPFTFSAAAAKLLQPCPTLCDPIDSSPPGSAVPGILQARTLEWVAISFSMNWTEHCPIPNNTNYIDKLVYYRWFSSNQQNNHSNFLWF